MGAHRWQWRKQVPSLGKLAVVMVVLNFDFLGLGVLTLAYSLVCFQGPPRP